MRKHCVNQRRLARPARTKDGEHRVLASTIKQFRLHYASHFHDGGVPCLRADRKKHLNIAHAKGAPRFPLPSLTRLSDIAGWVLIALGLLVAAIGIWRTVRMARNIGTVDSAPI